MTTTEVLDLGDALETDTDVKQLETLPWIEKYRPNSLDDIISQDNIIKTLKIFIRRKCLPHLLFYGPPGTGKTSTIMACAKELYGEYYDFMVMELNASDDRGIEVVRSKIKQFVSTKSVFFGKSVKERENIFKLVILDETDAMTEDAQAILRKVVEKYTSNTRFCLICNYIQKINPALQSRSTRFRFSPLSRNIIRKKVREIAKIEKVHLTKSGMETLLDRSHGDMRRVLNILQSVSIAHDTVNSENINNCIGYPQRKQIIAIINSLVNDSYAETYEFINTTKYDSGLSLNDIIVEIHDAIVGNILEGDPCGTDVDKLNMEQMIAILDKMRDVEYNQSINTNEYIQTGALVGIFKLCMS